MISNIQTGRLNARNNKTPGFVGPEREVIDRIQHDDAYVCRAVDALHRQQTPQEQSVKMTVEKNGVGLNAAHAWPVSRMAEHLDGSGVLTPEELAWCREPVGKHGTPRLALYRRQLLDLLPDPGPATFSDQEEQFPNAA